MSTGSFMLTDPQTNEMAFAMSSVTRADQFSSVSRHNYFSMLLIDKGAGTVTRDGAEYAFNSPCLICFSLYQPFAIHPEGELEGELICFHPSFFCLFKHRREVSCNGVLFNNLYDTPVVNLDNDGLGSLQTITRQIRQELQREKPDHDVVLSYLKIFLIAASRTKNEQRQAVANKNPSSVITQLEQAIETHFKTLRLPSAYSDLLHISEKALNRNCKQFYNKTLTTLIAERITIEAKRELYLTAKPVKQIAHELGYHDEFYFSRFFKKNVGVSPQIFREKVGFDKMN